MARPRVFVSSTFYDLRHVRADLEKFIGQIGYEPVLHERGNVAYGNAERLEKYCYKEIGQVDIVVNIIGGRFGSESFEKSYSISQKELKTAVELNKQVYVFVDRSVYAEYRLYLNNKEVDGVRYTAADDRRILSFIEEVEQLPKNNQLMTFETADDITHHLREQWAGLFQRFLEEQERITDRRIAEDMQSTLETLKQLVTYLAKEKKHQGSAISEILLSNHPIFSQIRKLTQTPYRVYFRDRGEMEAWLKARSWNTDGKHESTQNGYSEWARDDTENSKRYLLKVANSVFDDSGKLRVITADEWNVDWVSVQELPSLLEEEDDLPF